nr:hypothetical protein OG513_16795 [Streptomyces sp. NBC_00998]
MSTERAFGVGCIALEVSDADDIAKWQKSVSKALNEIASIRDLSFHDIDGFAQTRRDQLSVHGEPLHPLPTSGFMGFWVTIPTRVQEDLLDGRTAGEVEDFWVVTFFDRRHPITFVSSEANDESLKNPSIALMIVRRFLEREIGKIKDTTVSIRRVGPSPFHANCFVTSGEKGEPIGDGVTVEIQPRSGYNKFTFHHKARLGEVDVNEAYAIVAAWLKPELTLFYQVNSDRYARLRRSDNTMQLAENLSHTYAKSGYRSYFSRLLRNKRDLLTLRLAVLQCRLQTVHEQRDAHDAVTSLYSERGVQIIRPYTEKVSQDTYEEEVETAEKMLEILESQHTQEVQRFTTFCASLLGVTVGALLTAWLRR